MSEFENSKRLHGIIERIVYRILQKMDYVRAIPSTVTLVSGSNITCYLAGDDVSDVSVYQNRTNVTITPGDIVYVVMPNGRLTNAFIGWKQ